MGENETEGVVSINVESESVTFSSPAENQEDVATDNTDNECDEDCKSFAPLDQVKPAWQIARGKVSVKRSAAFLLLFWFMFSQSDSTFLSH